MNAPRPLFWCNFTASRQKHFVIPWSLTGILQRARSGVGSTPVDDARVLVVTSRPSAPDIERREETAEVMGLATSRVLAPDIVHLGNAVGHLRIYHLNVTQPAAIGSVFNSKHKYKDVVGKTARYVRELFLFTSLMRWRSFSSSFDASRCQGLASIAAYIVLQPNSVFHHSCGSGRFPGTSQVNQVK